MQSLILVASIFLYIFSAVYFVVISRKLFLIRKSKAANVVLFMISPSLSVFFSFLSGAGLEGVSEGIWQAVLGSVVDALFSLILQLAFLVIYVKVVRAKNPSIAIFVYLCSVMIVPGMIFLYDSTGPYATFIPLLLYIFLHVLFYKMIVVPLSEITKEKQVTNVKLFVILPVIAFIFNNLMYALFSATSAIVNFSTVDMSGMKEYLQSDPRGEAAQKILRILLDCMRAQTIVYIYPCIVTAVVLIIAVSTIVKNISYMNETIRAHRQVKALSVEVMEALAHTIDAKDEYTRGHSVRVAKYSKMIAQKMGLPAEECENVYYMGLLHDIGKIGVPNEIINKPARLTDDEYGVIKKHPMTGFDILAEIKTRPDLATGARWHHERYDGTGYPDHKKGGEIPLPARIIAVADSYDAMTSNRSYRKYLPQDVVSEEIRVNIGTQFDEVPAKAMLEIIDEDTEYKLHE